MNKPLAIHWFRQDLRLSDNPALYAAAQEYKVLPIYIHDLAAQGQYPRGAASRVHLHHSLKALDQALKGQLCIFQGDSQQIISQLARCLDVKDLYFNQSFVPAQKTLDDVIREQASALGITVHDYNGSLLWEPDKLRTQAGQPFQIFTPFYERGCLSAPPPRTPLPAPEQLELAQFPQSHSLPCPVRKDVDQLGLLPKVRWDAEFDTTLMIESGARQRLHDFCAQSLSSYGDSRDFPALNSVSQLSAALHFGLLSPHEVWYKSTIDGLNSADNKFHRQLAWREFCYGLLIEHDDLPSENLKSGFKDFVWNNNDAHLRAWQQGNTGVPLVDAGMRQLWQTGTMHNRVRMVVGSFLVKNLRISWRSGAQWFWDTLLDADLANNSASWQWIAGCGADAAPYFRIFNPILQAKKFDPNGTYIRQYLPQLKRVPDSALFADPRKWKQAGYISANDYPDPIVDIQQSRQSALDAFYALRDTTR